MIPRNAPYDIRNICDAGISLHKLSGPLPKRPAH